MVYRPLTPVPRAAVPGETVYLLHMTQPVGHAGHYIGRTRLAVARRIALHRSRRGAKLIAALRLAGGDVLLARVWTDAPRELEQRLKNRGGARRICPLCRGGVA